MVLRFKPGQPARIVRIRQSYAHLLGRECEVLQVLDDDPKHDYRIKVDGLERICRCKDHSLEPLTNPDIDETIAHMEDIPCA